MERREGFRYALTEVGVLGKLEVGYLEIGHPM